MVSALRTVQNLCGVQMHSYLLRSLLIDRPKRVRAVSAIISRPLKNAQFRFSSRKTKILTTGIHRVFRGLKFESEADI